MSADHLLGLGLWTILGVGYCFYGFKLFRWMCYLILGATGVLAGFVVFHQPGMEVHAWVAAGILGIAGFYLGYKKYLVGAFFIGALATLMAAEVILGSPQSTNDVIILAGLALAGGILCVWIQKPLIIGYTAWAGAFMLATVIEAGQMTRTQLENILVSKSGEWKVIGQQGPAFLVEVVVIFLAGCIIQHKYTAKDPPKKMKKKNKCEESNKGK